MKDWIIAALVLLLPTGSLCAAYYVGYSDGTRRGYVAAQIDKSLAEACDRYDRTMKAFRIAFSIIDDRGARR